jgi:hypothetical protein
MLHPLAKEYRTDHRTAADPANLRRPWVKKHAGSTLLGSILLGLFGALTPPLHRHCLPLLPLPLLFLPLLEASGSLHNKLVRVVELELLSNVGLVGLLSIAVAVAKSNV